MASDYSEINSSAEHWAQQAATEGWIEQSAAQVLLVEDSSSAHDLFSAESSRPLVVSFMGGTGVGKSSLLNRLAGQAIAKAGVERPTSREVTLYHHHSVTLHSLQETFPVQQIKVSSHSEVSSQHIIWMDMPDFDSTELKNKDIVLQWLPFIDVLIYVVSPERYRDNKAWQLLLAEGASHAWVFVLNQWDRGEVTQYEDFKKQLSKAGFHDPLIYKTVCTEQIDDEFSQLQHAIEAIATEKIIHQLESRGLQQRRLQLKHKLQDCKQTLGQQQVFALLTEYQKTSWSQTKKVLRQGFQWPVQQVAKQYSETITNVQQKNVKIWDDWAQSRLNDYLDDLIVTANQHGLPTIPIRKTLMGCRHHAEKIIQTQTELACRQALIHPGNALQRTLLKTAHICEIILPFMAMSIVGFQVFQGFYDSSISNEAFLGVNFAIHSGLLILLSWLLPFFIRKKMQPSLEKAASKGLFNGLNEAMAMLDIEVKQGLNTFKQQHAQRVETLDQIIVACDSETDKTALNPTNQQLDRMLVN